MNLHIRDDVVGFGVPTTKIASAMGITYHQADLLVRKARAAGLSKLPPKGARR